MDLAAGATPLVAVDAEPPGDRALPVGTVTITEVGRAVLAGAADWVRLDGFDRWLGGVHLSAAPGADVDWRYDRNARALVRV